MVEEELEASKRHQEEKEKIHREREGKMPKVINSQRATGISMIFLSIYVLQS